MAIYSWFSHWKWWLSIVMYSYVSLPEGNIKYKEFGPSYQSKGADGWRISHFWSTQASSLPLASLGGHNLDFWWRFPGQTIQYWSYPVVNYVHYTANGYSKWFISMLFRIFMMYWWIQYGYDLWGPYMDVNEDDVWTWILTCHEAKPWTNAPHGLVLCPVGWLWNKLSWFCPASGWICNFCSSLCVNGLDWGKILIGNHGF